jgi:branched-chain amino acid transport system permease protein
LNPRVSAAVFGCGVLLAAILLPLGLDPQGYAIRVFTLIFLFAAMAQSWNIVGGLANQMSLGHAAFFGIGAYTSTLLLIHAGLSPWLGMGVAAILGGAAAALLSLPTMRLSGHYFALATLAFGEVMRVLANTWATLTGGPGGISVPFAQDSWWMLNFKSTRPHYYLTLGALLAITAIFVAVQRSAFGYRLRAIRENIAAAEVVGVDSVRTKILAAMLSGGLIAALGTLYAQLTFFFDPDTVFGIAPVSIRVALIAILGGAGVAIGPIIGALVIIPLEEGANFVFASQAAGLSGLVYGLLLVTVILVEPRGLVALMGLGRRRRSGA